MEFGTTTESSRYVIDTFLVLPDRIELSTSPLPRECSTTELRQQNRALLPLFLPAG
jgi:hypothetical protein